VCELPRLCKRKGKPLWSKGCSRVEAPVISETDSVVGYLRSIYGYRYTRIEDSASEEGIQPERTRNARSFRRSLRTRHYVLFAILIVGCLLLFMDPSSEEDCQPSPRVTVRNGTLSGIHDASLNQDLFLGIPYAQPPIGQSRFRQSLPSSQWHGVKTATHFGYACPAYESLN
jgi:hypothetical protein